MVLDRALLFLYEQVLDEKLGNIGSLDRAERPKRLPTVLSRDQVRRLFAALSPGPNRLIAHLLWGRRSSRGRKRAAIVGGPASPGQGA